MTIKKLSMDDLGRMDKAAFKESPKLPVVLVLDDIRSAHNIGSIFRTADAFRVEAIYLTGFCARPPHKEIMKTALGATESVHWEYFETTSLAIEKLRSNGFFIASLEQVSNSIPLQEFTPREKTAFIFGNEVHGVALDIIKQSDACIEIPQFGTKHSFNVSITTGIVLWDTYLKLNRILRI